jgi:hypothetical protein
MQSSVFLAPLLSAIPSTEQGQLEALRELLFDGNCGITFDYFNNTNVIQTNARKYQLAWIKSDVTI